MIKTYNKNKISMRIDGLQDSAYQKLTAATLRAAQAPATTPRDSFVKLVKVTALNSVRRYQFFRPNQSRFVGRMTAEAISRAVYQSRGQILLPLGNPLVFGHMALHGLLGTGEKTRWVSPELHPALLAVAVLTRSGLVGLSEVLAYRTGRKLQKAGHDKLARASFVAAAGLSCGLAVLRAGLSLALFAAQIPYTVLCTALSLGTALARAAYHGSLTPADCGIAPQDGLVERPMAQGARATTPSQARAALRQTAPAHLRTRLQAATA